VTGVQVLVNAEGNELDISWNAVGGDVAGYRIYRNSTVSAWVLLVTTTNTYYNDTGLVNGRTYYYMISAYDEVPNYGQNSTIASGTPQDTVAPNPVSIISVTPVATGNQLIITWTSSNSSDVEGYNLYNATSEFGPYTLLISTPKTQTSYTHSGLIDGQVYWYKVAPIDEVPNEGQNSTAVNGTPQDTVPPAQVTGLVVTNPTTGKTLDLSWNAVSDPDLAGYRIYRRNSTSNYSLLTTVAASDNFYKDTTVIDNILYYYKVAAIDEVPNEGANSTEVGAVPSNEIPPAKVRDLTVTGINDTALRLQWAVNTEPDLKLYRIYRSTSSGFTPGPSNNIANVTVPYYNDTGLTTLQNYYYRVSAVDIAELEGAFSDQKVGVPGATLLNKTDNISVIVITTGNSLNITWNAISGAAYYKIYRYTVSGTLPSPSNLLDTTTNTYYIDTGLIDGNTYYYRVSGVSSEDIEGYFSDEVNGTPSDTVPPAQIDTVPPAQIVNVTVTNPGTGNKLTITWNASDAPDFVHYLLYRNSTVENWALIASPTTNSYVDTGLVDGRTYYYKVAAVDDGGPVQNVGQNSTVTSGIPTDITPPPQITWSANPIKVIPEGKALNITWNPSTASDFKEYKLYRNSTTEDWILLDNLTVNHYLDTGLINGMTYWYKVSAVDEVPNYGLNSTVVKGVPQDSIAPAAVTGLTVHVIPTGNTLNLTWNPNSESDISYYKVYMSTVTPFTPGPSNYVWNVSHPTTFYLNSSLIDGQAYYFKVSAVDEDGNEGPIITQVSGVPADLVAPPQVTGLTIVVVPTGNALNLQWDNLSQIVSDVVGYNIYRSTSPGITADPTYYIDSTSNIYYNDTGLTDNVTYYYLITAYDEVPNEGNASSIVNGTPSDKVPPAQIVNVIVTNPGTGNKLTITWNASDAPDFVHYLIPTRILDW